MHENMHIQALAGPLIFLYIFHMDERELCKMICYADRLSDSAPGSKAAIF
jgi:hypothetical protein